MNDHEQLKHLLAALCEENLPFDCKAAIIKAILDLFAPEAG